MTRNKHAKNGKRKQISTYLTPELHERLHALQASINQSQKVDWKLWQVIELLIERGWQFTDPATGKLKLPPLAAVPAFAGESGEWSDASVIQFIKAVGSSDR